MQIPTQTQGNPRQSEGARIVGAVRASAHGPDPFDRRDDLGVGEIPAGSSDAPEAGGVKL